VSRPELAVVTVNAQNAHEMPDWALEGLIFQLLHPEAGRQLQQLFF
jgi:hypothetical protein